jgi:hypothetical protein
MSTSAIALVGAALAASILISGTGQAQAQTCSGFYEQCVQHPKTKNPKSCVAAKAACMRTGRFIGPETGRDYGSAEKK